MEINESFVVALCFIIFLMISFRPIRKAILNSLDAKIAEIKLVMINAQKMRDEAKKLLEECKVEMENFEDAKAMIIEKATKSTDNLVELRKKEIESHVDHMRDSALKSIESMRSNASVELQKEFTSHVMNLVQSYMEESNNNNSTNEEILKKFLKK